MEQKWPTCNINGHLFSFTSSLGVFLQFILCLKGQFLLFSAVQYFFFDMILQSSIFKLNLNVSKRAHKMVFLEKVHNFQCHTIFLNLIIFLMEMRYQIIWICDQRRFQGFFSKSGSQRFPFLTKAQKGAPEPSMASSKAL